MMTDIGELSVCLRQIWTDKLRPVSSPCAIAQHTVQTNTPACWLLAGRWLAVGWAGRSALGRRLASWQQALEELLGTGGTAAT